MMGLAGAFGREGLAVTKAMESVVENLKSLRSAIEVEVAAIDPTAAIGNGRQPALPKRAETVRNALSAVLARL